ncbi:MAG: DNA internalization-related competence protein ComEC/Rec2 [Rubrivivax sp.]|nr:MAG: DNA internalization-related competence protein ComEC/Rec2 [Rubrivivax sp.]
MVVHWGAVLLAWLAGVAMQLQQADAREARAAVVLLLAMPMMVLCWRWWAPMPWRRGWIGASPWCIAALAMGWAWTQWLAVDRLAQQWPSPMDGEPVLITGRVDSLPQISNWGQRFEVEVASVERGGRRWAAGQRWQLPGVSEKAVVPARVSISWSEPGSFVPLSAKSSGHEAREVREIPAAHRVVPGQVWRWTARLSPPRSLSNPGGFDAEFWLFDRGLRAQGKVVTRDAPAPLLVRPVSWGSPALIERWRMTLRDRALAHVRDPQLSGLIIGLTIGDQSAITPRDWEVLRDTGTAHLAAISGTHVTMMGWLVSWLTGHWWRRSWARMHWLPTPVASRLAGFVGALLYAFLSGWGVPAQRTVIMLCVVTWLQLSSRRWPWPLVLLLAAVAVTVLDPWALLQAGFWLSFAAVGLLMLSGRDEQAAPGLPWPARVAAAARTLWRTQWVAWLGLAPLSLVFFQQVSVVGLLANAVCIPLFTMLITPLCMIGMAVPAIWQTLAPLVHGTMAVLEALAQWRWASVAGASVAGWAAALGLLAGAWMLAPVPWRWRVVALPALLPLLWPTSWSQPLPSPPMGQMDVLAVDIGQGTSVLVRTARHALLYDAGPRISEDVDAGQRVLVGLLRSLGVGRLDQLMISHGDNDHVGGAASVVKAVPVSALRSSLEAGHELMQVPDADGQRPPHTDCVAGQQWVWDGVRFEVLHPTLENWQGRARISDNDMSCVLRIRPEGSTHSLLLTGDIEKVQEAALVGRLGQALASEVLVVPHHGSRTSSTAGLLEAVAPKLAVIQAGASNRYGHPHPTVVSRYQARSVPVVETAHCGAWLWRSGDGPAAEQGRCWRDGIRRYWHAPRATEPLTVSPADQAASEARESRLKARVRPRPDASR